MATATIDEVTIDVRATIWEFEMARGWTATDFLTTPMSTKTNWDAPMRYCMTLIPDGLKSSRAMACFYGEDEMSSLVQDVLDGNGGGSAELALPWEVFCRCVERLDGATGPVKIPGRNGEFKLDGDGSVIYTTECRSVFRIDRDVLEALAR